MEHPLQRLWNQMDAHLSQLADEYYNNMSNVKSKTNDEYDNWYDTRGCELERVFIGTLIFSPVKLNDERKEMFIQVIAAYLQTLVTGNDKYWDDGAYDAFYNLFASYRTETENK